MGRFSNHRRIGIGDWRTAFFHCPAGCSRVCTLIFFFDSSEQRCTYQEFSPADVPTGNGEYREILWTSLNDVTEG